MTDDTPFGPWAAQPSERIAAFRSLASLTAIFVGADSDLVRALRRAETSDDAAARARALFDAVPTRTQRKILSTWGAACL